MLTDIKKKLQGIIDNYYWLVMIFFFPLVIWLNYYAGTMQEWGVQYYDYKRIILAGFDPTVAKLGLPTFYMWGYGWLFIITENKMIILFLQNVFAIFSLKYFVNYLRQKKIIAPAFLRLFKVVLIFSFPYYAIQSVLSPYSIAISLFLFSLILFLKSIQDETEKPILTIIISGLLFGLLLNFRSDYLFLPIVFIFIIFPFFHFRLEIIKRTFIWVAIIFICMLPWMTYTYHVNGHVSIGSTNGWHIIFLGLGDMPDNKWGITPTDNDPVLKKMIKSINKRARSLTYIGEQATKKAFLQLISQDPGEYFRKCRYSLIKVMTDGTYPGAFYEHPNCAPNCLQTIIPKEKRAGLNISAIITNKQMFLDISNNFLSLFPEYKSLPVRLLFFGFSMVLALLVVFISFCVSWLNALYHLYKPNLVILIFLAIIGYQSSINILAGHKRLYTTNVYLFHLLNIFIFVNIVYNIFIKHRSPLR